MRALVSQLSMDSRSADIALRDMLVIPNSHSARFSFVGPFAHKWCDGLESRDFSLKILPLVFRGVPEILKTYR